MISKESPGHDLVTPIPRLKLRSTGRHDEEAAGLAVAPASSADAAACAVQATVAAATKNMTKTVRIQSAFMIFITSFSDLCVNR